MTWTNIIKYNIKFYQILKVNLHFQYLSLLLANMWIEMQMNMDTWNCNSLDSHNYSNLYSWLNLLILNNDYCCWPIQIARNGKHRCRKERQHLWIKFRNSICYMWQILYNSKAFCAVKVRFYNFGNSTVSTASTAASPAPIVFSQNWQLKWYYS